MDRREVCFLVGRDASVLWSDAGTSPVAIADSRARWERIWELRTHIVEIAHTHPLGGAHFSQTDETTMEALDSALGQQLIYSVVTPNAMLRRTPGAVPRDALVEHEPWWTALLRTASGIEDVLKKNDDE